MKRTAHHTTAFYLETLLLVCLFVAVILILTQCFAAAESSGERAEELTNAVYLARNAAEAAAESGEPSELAGLLLSGEKPEGMKEAELLIRYDEELRHDSEGKFLLRVAWEEEDGREDSLISYRITVEDAETQNEIYTLETAVYLGRDAA